MVLLLTVRGPSPSLLRPTLLELLQQSLSPIRTRTLHLDLGTHLLHLSPQLLDLSLLRLGAGLGPIRAGSLPLNLGLEVLNLPVQLLELGLGGFEGGLQLTSLVLGLGELGLPALTGDVVLGPRRGNGLAPYPGETGRRQGGRPVRG